MLQLRTASPLRIHAAIGLVCIAYGCPGLAQPNGAADDPAGEVPGSQVSNAADFSFDSFDESEHAGADQPASFDAAAVAEPDAATSFWSSDLFEPLRVTLAQEASYKVEKPNDFVKNRSSLRMEYSKYFLENLFLQFDGKSTLFLDRDHRREEGSDSRITQAYLQTSFRQTSISLGVQTVAWGESILAPITDEVSPRDNRELFNFNLEELRIGQPMLALDQYSGVGRWSFFLTPDPSFNENPRRGSAYYFDPFDGGVEFVDGGGDDGMEYGVNWRKTFGSADFSVMAASLIDNDYALRLNAPGDAPGRIARETNRYSLAGMTFSYAISKFLLKGELGVKSRKAYNTGALQIVEKEAVDSYLGVEYRHSATLTLGAELLNQHISGWNSDIQSAPADRQSLLLTLTQLMKNDDLSINVLAFYNRPDSSMLGMLLTSYQWNDNLTLGLNAIYPYTDSANSSLWNVRDQKQLVFRVQYQF